MIAAFPTELNPNGIPSLSPGLRGTSYPGLASNPLHNPERVAANPRRSIHAGRFNPFRVEDHFALTPRAAPSSQPRADGCNPFGMGLRASGLEAAGFSAETQRRRDAEKAVRPLVPSPLNGERVRVRGDAVERAGHVESLTTFPPLTPALSPLRGEGEAVSASRYSPTLCASAPLRLCGKILSKLNHPRSHETRRQTL